MGKILDIPGFGIVRDEDVGETKMFKSSREDYENEVARIGCSEYSPCPICYKCMNKSGHMYEQCESCKVPLCHHNQGVREKMIRPNNFTLEAKGDLEASLLKDIANYEKLKANGFKKKSKSKEDK